MAAFNFHRRKTRRWWYAGTALAAAVVFAVVFVAGSSALISRSSTACTAAPTDALDATNAPAGNGGVSNFEIDHASSVTVKNKTTNTLGANLYLNSSACLDWSTFPKNTSGAAGGGNSTGTASDLLSGVLVKPDAHSGSGDDSFGQGTSENNAVPTIVSGSIPPNKSDLLNFGIYRESNASGKFLELFWNRQNAPSGTVDMDFELNQKVCDGTATNCANNATNGASTPNYVTPLRTNGDRLITYDLASGGTVPTISIYTWNAANGDWESGQVISGGNNAEALGSINFDSIAQLDSAGLGAMDPLTFGEVSVSYKALFGTGTSGCGSFGSVYLKSRSSNTFTDELKDFIAPEPVQITNCSQLQTSASNQSSALTISATGVISDTATLSNAVNPTGSVTFNAYGPFDASTSDSTDSCTGTPAYTKTVSTFSGPDSSGNYTFSTPTTSAAGGFVPTKAGRYDWKASYGGDANNVVSSATTCPASAEESLVKETPTLATSLTNAGPINAGGSDSDTATLTWNSSFAPTGTVTYTIYTDDQCTVQATTSNPAQISAQPGSQTITTGGSIPGSGSVTFNASGTYYWQASYGGDSNFNSAKSPCTSETLVVNLLPSTISTSQMWYPNDTATVGGGGTGTVTFTLYKNSMTCASGAVTGLSGIAVTLSSGSASTNNGPSGNTQNVAIASPVTSGDAYYWKAVYSGDSTHKPVTSCVEATTFTSLSNGGTVTSP